MKIIIWLLCLFACVIVQVVAKYMGYTLGAIPTILLYSTCCWLARTLCVEWDSHKQSKKLWREKQARDANRDFYVKPHANTDQEMPTVPQHIESIPTPDPQPVSAAQNDDLRKPPASGQKLRKLLLPVLAALAILVSGYVLVNSFLINKAIDTQQFSKAKRYCDNLLVYDVLFPGEYAYIEAGVLLEGDSYLEALSAFEAVEGYHVPDSVLTPLKERIYLHAQDAYHRNSYSVARMWFSDIPDYKNSDDYLLLIKYHLGKSGSFTSSDSKQLISLMGFEDADKLILSVESSAYRFLNGQWKGGSYSFSVSSRNNQEVEILFDLPCEDVKKWLSIQDGILYSISYNPIEIVHHFSIDIVDEDTIRVYCYKDSSTHFLHRVPN